MESHPYSPDTFPNVKFHFRQHFSMIDGKEINSLASNKSTRRCPVCLCGPKDLQSNNVKAFEVKNEAILKHGIASLHFGPRCIEWLLHVGFRQDFKAYDKRYTKAEKEIGLDKEHKALEKARAEKICTEMWKATGYEPFKANYPINASLLSARDVDG